MNKIMMIVLCAFLSACDDGMQNRSPSNTYEMDKATLEKTISKAKAGDVRAMNRLVDYYWIYETNESKKAVYWLRRAAMAGDAEARESYIGYCQAHSKKSNDQCELELKP